MFDIAPLVGWQYGSPSIRFDFTTTATLDNLTIWFADSNGAAGVGMPASVLLTTTTGFSQSFGVTDPAGSGFTVPVSFSGFSVDTDHVIVTVTPGFEWTMISEVAFTAVIPEPAATAALTAAAFGMATIGLRRRQRQSAVA